MCAPESWRDHAYSLCLVVAPWRFSKGVRSGDGAGKEKGECATPPPRQPSFVSLTAGRLLSWEFKDQNGCARRFPAGNPAACHDW